MVVVRKPTVGQRLKAFRQLNRVGLPSLDLSQIEPRLVGECQVPAVGRNDGAGDGNIPWVGGCLLYTSPSPRD